MDVKKRLAPAWCKSAAPAVAVAGAVTVIALVWSFPLVLAPGEMLWGFPGDSLATLQRWEGWQASTRYIERPVLNLAGRAVAKPLGPLLAYNLLVLLSFPLSAVTAYALCRRIVQQTPAAMVGAVVYALSPFHWAHSLGHIYEAHIQWIPLLAVCVLSFASHPSIPMFLAVALTGAVLLGSSFYYGFFTAVVALPLAAAALVLLLVQRRGGRLVIGLAALAGVLLATLPVTHAYLTWLGRLRKASFGNEEDLIRYSARPREYLMPGPFSALRRVWNPVTTPGTLHLSNEVEQSLFLGWVPLALATVGALGALGRSRGSGPRRSELGWIVSAGLIAAVCSAPPQVSMGHVVLPMPAHYLGRWVPFFRVYARMAVIVTAAVACSAAAGWAVLARRHPSLGMVAALLILVEFTPLPPPRAVRIFPLRGAYAWIRRHAGDEGILEYPLDSRITPRTSVRGYLAGLTGLRSLEETEASDVRHPGRLDDAAVRNLAMAGVDHLLLHDRNPDPPLQVYKDRPERGPNIPGEWPVLESREEMTLAAHFPETVIFRLSERASPVSVAAGDGMGPWLEGTRSVGRSMMSRSSILLRNRCPWPCLVDVAMDLEPLARLSGWRVTFNGVPVAERALCHEIRLEVKELEALPDNNILGLEALDNEGRPFATDGPIARLRGLWITKVSAVGGAPTIGGDGG